MTKIKRKIENLAKLKGDFQLRENTQSSELEQIKKRQTFSEVDDKRIIGRKIEKEKIINLLLRAQNEEEISFIPIVGLGGLGKTTLAQLVYNDAIVKKAFDLRAWVYVSMEFDLKRIGEAIISQIKQEHCDFNNMQSVRNSLETILVDKRCLIILDDVWSEDEDDLNDLKLMIRGGCIGSKIIITTRSKKIGMIMGTGDFHNLELLTDDDCWYLVKQRVFDNRADESDLSIEENQETKSEIAKKCNGVPLAANSIASIILFLGGFDAWPYIKNVDTWDPNGSDQGYPSESKILKSLMLSYYHMPSPLKLCFAYCAIFPKGCAIDKGQLIQQWIALGFVQPTNWCPVLEKIGEEYVNNLLWMSFLQYSTAYDKNKEILCMHDLVHDLARNIAADEILILDGRKDRNSSHKTRDSRYVLIVNYKDSALICKVVPKKARALHFKDCSLLKISKKVLGKTKRLRILNMSGCCNKTLPTTIHKLKQLMYLDVSCLPMKILNIPSACAKKLHYLNMHGCSNLHMLPDLITNLQSLHYLDLSNCTNLRELPESIGNLIKLLFLNLSNNHELQKLPISISKLKELINLNLSDCYNLQTLPDFVGNLNRVQVLDLSWCLKLHKLTDSIVNLKDLQYLDLSNWSHLKYLPNVIGNLQKLQSLNLSGCTELEILPESITNLSYLLNLGLSDCRSLQKLPESFGNLYKLQQLNLSACIKLEELPISFGNLRTLRILNLSSCYGLHKLPETFTDLLKLENLDLSDCCSLVELPNLVNNNLHLRKLDILGCSSLIRLPKDIEMLINKQRSDELQRLPQLFECKESWRDDDDIISCNIIKLENLNQTSGKIHITCLENVVRPGDAERAKLCEKWSLRSLALQWTTNPNRVIEGTMIDEVILENLRPHRNLELFTIDGYSGKKFPSWATELASFLPNLVKINFCNLGRCERLPSFEQLPNLENLEIRNAPIITKVDISVSKGKQAFRKLQTLILSELPNLIEWRTTLSSKNEEMGFPRLQKMEINKCPHLRFGPFFPEAVNVVIIDSCEVLSSEGKGSRKSRTSKMYIEKCGASYHGWSTLEYLTNLEYLEIKLCEEMETLPDGIRSLGSLKCLHVSSCRNLMVLPDWLAELKLLRSLTIRGCHNLPRSKLHITTYID